MHPFDAIVSLLIVGGSLMPPERLEEKMARRAAGLSGSLPFRVSEVRRYLLKGKVPLRGSRFAWLP